MEYLYQLKDWVHLLVMIFSNFTDIGGNMINITIVFTSETCVDGKYNHFLLLEKLKELVSSCTYNLDIVVKAIY